MSDHTEFLESDPRYHTAKIKQMLTEILEQARQGVAKVSEPQAQALFETTAEVLTGLRKAYEHYEQHSERAWNASAGSSGGSQ